MKPSVLDILGDHIVNPRCDECGASVTPANPLLGPHLCMLCNSIGRAIAEADYKNYLEQERPDRRVHVVKLPPEMITDKGKR